MSPQNKSAGTLFQVERKLRIISWYEAVLVIT
jgi:hypothetical protein